MTGTRRPPRRGAPRVRRRLGLPTTMVGRRTALLTVVYLVAFLIVLGRLVDVQVLNAQRWSVRGEEQRARTIALPAQRGRIYDRAGQVLATSVDAATIYADPRKFRPTEGPDGVEPPQADARATAAQLAPILGIAPDELRARLRQDRHFVYLARQLPWREGERIAALGLQGVGVLAEPSRVYPAGALGGQILGFVGLEGTGLAGLEAQYDPLLGGKPGELALERSPGGLAIASGVRELTPSEAGADLVLTIDREIQHAAERVAAETRKQQKAKAASIVVLDVDSGDVLAAASAPGLDPNRFATADAENWGSRAVTDIFEPGSVQKAVTAAAALDAGAITTDTAFTVPDHYEVGGKTFTDDHKHPPERMALGDIIETSSNVGTIMVAQELGAQRLYDYLRAFGYAQPLGVGFPGEEPGLLAPPDQWWDTSLPTIAIGHGVATTLLQTASFYATIANDGTAVQPRILRGTVGEDGRLEPAAPAATRQVIAPEVSRQLRPVLARVVRGEGGTGKKAAVPGYDVAGKTGTAKKPNENARGYSGEYFASFVGFAPVGQPELVVAVMVDEPAGRYGGTVAAPAFREVMQFALVQRQVPPTRDDVVTAPTIAAPSE